MLSANEETTNPNPPNSQAAEGAPAAKTQEPSAQALQGRRSVPDFIARTLGRYTRELGDNPKFAKSNITHATKLYYFACDYIRDCQEDPEGWYTALLGEAKQKSYLITNVKHRNPANGNPNRIPAFFDALEKLFAFTPDELAYIRSDLPLVRPEDRDS